jgi:membrane peptidoglycan carboxypeptidase
VRTALGNSINIPAVKALEFVGIPNAVDLATRMGITTWGPDSGKNLGLSLVLGGAEVRPVDMAQVYATFANNGRKIPLTALRQVVDADGNVLFDYQVPQGDQVLDLRAAYMITNILSDPKAKLFTYGRNTPLILGDRPAASKTGTTDNSRDTWTDGYTPDLAIVVWVGNTDGHPMNQALSTMTAGKIWPEAMQASFDALGLPPVDFPRPDGLAEGQVCGDTALRPGEPRCRTDLFLAGQVPTPAPTVAATEAPTPAATEAPTAAPTEAPTAAPTQAPTTAPTQAATSAPTHAPTLPPAPAPPAAPAAQRVPTQPPAPTPAPKPQVQPTAPPKPQPTAAPAKPQPTSAPTQTKPQATPAHQ